MGFGMQFKGAYTTICLRARSGLRMNLRVRRVTSDMVAVACGGGLEGWMEICLVDAVRLKLWDFWPVPRLCVRWVP